MIQYMYIKDGRLEETESPESAEIIRMVAPSEAELREVSTRTQAPPEFLAAACDKDERPRIETEDDAKLIVLRVPHEEPGSEIPVVTVAFGVIITASHILSVCSVGSPVWESLAKTRGRLPPASKRTALLCNLFMSIARLYLAQLQRIRTEADTVERELHHSMRNEMLIRMLNLEKGLVYFTTSLRGCEPLWDRFRRIQGPNLSEEELEMIEDVRIEFRQAQDLADIHSNILTGMMDAFASVISNNLNVVMKFLTAATIILMLPTLVASIYGMNIQLPFQESPNAFVITMLMSIILAIGGVIVFLRKKFF